MSIILLVINYSGIECVGTIFRGFAGPSSALQVKNNNSVKDLVVGGQSIERGTAKLNKEFKCLENAAKKKQRTSLPCS